MKNTLYDIMLKRRSIRKFKPEVVSDEDIKYLLEIATSGPSACNKQPWEFYVIKNKEILEKLMNVGRYTKMKAPLAVIVCGNQNRSLSKKDNDYWIQDCSSAMTNLLLGVTALGLSACWCGVYPQKTVVKNTKELLQLEEHIIPLGIAFIGYPDEEKEPRTQYKKDYIHIIE